MSGGHPLPASEEARTDELPEGLEQRKGHGDDGAAAARVKPAVNPNGTPYATTVADRPSRSGGASAD